MTKKIFRSIFFSSLGMFLGTIILLMAYLYHYFTQLELDQLQTQTTLVAQAVEQEGKTYLENWQESDTRVTWIQPDGQVIFDSEKLASQMENHGNREEVQEAVETGYGESVRYSSTLTEQLLYSAQALPDGTVIRLALSQETILILLGQMVPWLGLLFLLSIIVAVFLARLTARKLLKPLEEINLEQPLANDVYVELHPLLKRLDQHQRDLLAQERLLRQKTDEFDTIIGKMKEGLVLLDRKGKLLSYNSAASQILELETGAVGGPLLSLHRYPTLKSLLEKTLSGKKSQEILVQGAATYKVLGRPIWSEGTVSGAVLLFFDETEQQALEAMRKEFTANVSHELRTPLQIMAGYSELMQAQELPDQALLFSQKIDKEAKRMIALVEDILFLSQLDEVTEISRENIQLKGLLQDILTSLEDKAALKGVSLRISGDNTSLEGNRGILHSVLYNLCDNAIKYNRENGSVDLIVEEEADRIELQITDTGIGISSQDQERIFERFYRADKSRSKKVGGTGLGLSIVKHGLQLHHAKIEVSSQLGQGTTMRLVFPKASKTSMN